jgi:murein DD-endopeptidase MepM/ murein hydrolase activator NlpD
LISLLFALAAITANQGSALQLRFPNEPGVTAVEGEWQQKKVPFVRVQDEWVSVIGVDLDVKPGEYKADVSFTFQDGRQEKREAIVDVKSTEYPTTNLTVEDRFVQLNPKDLARANRETKEINTIYSAVTKDILWTKPFTVPIPGETGRNFGHRRVFNGEPRAPHNGADLRAKTGTPIHSANRGRVVLAKNLFFTGNTVIVDHGLGIFLLYAHLSRIDVKPGAIVENGQVVGLAGATGRVTGPHLHWGVRIQGARVDPFSLVELK